MFFTHLLIPLIGVFLVFLSFIVFTRAQKYLKKEKRISEIEDQYERLRSSRRDFLHHMYWARSNEEHKRADQLEQEVYSVDDQLAVLKEEFDLIVAGKDVPLKNIPSKKK